ncbi:MAG: DUF1788 domain-containing protein [Armatimonadetes bacterium CG_4_8_14_3_um_filter_66_20]|nr:MAG: DUF1788 domain-containing protein [Armatimonadetes bacterium CG_4_8_14_3_um_filter_66_20]
MGRIEELASVYERHVSAPWQRTLAGAQRVMLVVYEKELERTLRARVGEFEQATRRSGHDWKLVDCTRWFAEWMVADDYRDAYFDDPSLLGMKLDGEFKREVVQRFAAELETADRNTVVAVLGVASLYGFLRISELIREVEQSIRGRLVVLFPGTKDENNYRLLDARDGWNYLANGITLHGGGSVS